MVSYTIYFKRKETMKVNVNHPTFISFLDNVTTNILSNITVDNYFSLSQEKKLGTQYMVYKLMKNSVKVRAKLTDDELKSFVNVLWKKNEESENYEFAAVLSDISNNFDMVNEVTKPVKRTPRKIKTDTTENG
jgi:hypothetical protein